MDKICENCETDKGITKHHLFPRSARRMSGVPDDYDPLAKMDLCYTCHAKVHKLKSTRELALGFSTKEKIRELLSTESARNMKIIFDEYGVNVTLKGYDGGVAQLG